MRTGVAEFVPVISRELILGAVADREWAESLAGRGLRSYLTVPLKARARMLGSLTFVTAGSGRYLTAADVRLAELLAECASTAVENARLYEALREADRRKDQFLAVLAHELRNPLAPLAHVDRGCNATIEASHSWKARVIGSISPGTSIRHINQ